MYYNVKDSDILKLMMTEIQNKTKIFIKKDKCDDLPIILYIFAPMNRYLTHLLEFH